MNFDSKKTSLLISAITSIVFSGAMFSFFNDPEGPNLLVVMGMAVMIYILSLAVIYLLGHSIKGNKRLLLVIIIQILIASGFYFYLS